jgi:predicted Zn-dependent peptidase
VKNERSQNGGDGVLSDLGSSVRAELFPAGHPYWNADGGLDADDVGLADVRAFLATWYLPSNATLAIAGRFDRDAVVAAVQRYFGPLPSASPPARPAAEERSAPSVRIVLRAPLNRSRVFVEWPTPAFGTAEDAALDLVAIALAGAGNERLTRALVAPGLAMSVSARQASNALASTFVVAADVPITGKPRQVAALIRTQVEDFARTVRADEVARARDVILRRSGRALETTWGRAERLATMAEIGIFPGPAFDWEMARYRDLRPPEVSVAATKWLAGGRDVEAIALPDPRAPIHGAFVRRDEVADAADHRGSR